jgi:uncharacterized membrane protein YhhN
VIQLLTAITGAVAVALAALERRPARYVLKPLASAGFVAVAVSSGAGDTAYGRWILAGLLGAIGDVALLRSDDRSFLVGLGSFLLGHLAYVVGFLQVPTGGWVVAAAGGTVVGMTSWRWLGRHVRSPMRVPVGACVAVITTMLVVALASWPERMLATVGAILFTASDLAVARERFIAPSRWNPRVGLPLYYGGQILIALSTAAVV